MRVFVTRYLLLVLSFAVRPLSAQLTYRTDAQGQFSVVTATGEAPRWRLDSIATLKDVDGVGFKAITSVLIDPKGGTLVGEATPALHRYDDRGKEIEVLGRQGGGPSEYKVIASLGWLGDNLALYDPSNARLAKLTPKGVWLAQWQPPMQAQSFRVYSVEAGAVWLHQFGIDPQGKRSHNFIRYPQLGRDDTLWLPYVPPLAPSGNGSATLPGTVTCTWGKGMLSDFGSAFDHEVHADLPIGHSLRVRVRGTDYRVAVINARGDTIRVLRHEFSRVPVTDAEWSDSTKDYHDFTKAHPDASCKGSLVRPAYKPAVLAVEADDKGRIWVERTAVGGVRWDIWDGDRLIGWAPSPRRYFWRPMDIRAGRMAVIRESTEDGGSEVVVYRVGP